MKTVLIYISLLLAGLAPRIYVQAAPVLTTEHISTLGATATVSVTVTDFSNITSGDLKIKYNPAVAVPVNVASGNGLGGTFSVNLSSPGEIIIGWFRYPPVTLADHSKLFVITFNKAGAGTSAISFDENGDNTCQFYDDSFSKINDSPFENHYLAGSLTFSEQKNPVTKLPAVKAKANENITVPVSVTGFTNIGAVSLKLEYNPEMLTFLSSVNTGGFPGMVIFNPAPGVITVSGFTNTPEGYSLPGEPVLFTLSFTYLGGTAYLEWSDDGASCEYAAPLSAFVFPDTPQNEYYINGTVTEEPAVPVIAVSETVQPGICGGQGSIRLALTHVPDGTYAISYTGGSFAGAGVTAGAATIEAPAGIYNDLQVQVGALTSAPGVNAILTDPPAPGVPEVETITQPACNKTGGSVVFNGLPAGNWTINPGAITGSGITVTIENISAGTWHYTVTNEAGCISAPTEGITINAQPAVPDVPVITAEGPLTFCEGGSVTLTTGEAATYLWTGGQTTRSISVSEPGSYTVTVANEQGCSATSQPVVVTVIPALPVEVGISPDATSVCTGTEITITATPVNGGDNPGYEWFVNGTPVTGENSAVYTYTPADEDKVYVRLTSTGSCIKGSPALSDTIMLHVDENPPQPAVACYESATWNSETCRWEISGTQPGKPSAVNCWDHFVFDDETCTWKNTGSQPAAPEKENCWDDYRFNANTCEWENTGMQPAAPATACYETATWNASLCTWEVSGVQPAQPERLNCWDEYTIDGESCTWKNLGTKPAAPEKVNCWDDYRFNTNTCEWENTGSQPAAPPTACYESAAWNASLCAWEVTGTKPAQPAKVNCWDEFVFDDELCTWNITGARPAEPAKEYCWENYQFNTNTCEWENTGMQPVLPETACYETAVWNASACAWEVTGTQPAQPARVNCWDEFVFDAAGCLWENQGVMPGEPAKVNTWDEFVFNTSLCKWENTGVATGTFSPGTQPGFGMSVYPNPANERATIRFSLPGEGSVDLEVIGASGKRAWILAGVNMSAGNHSAVFEAAGWAAGIYQAILRFTPRHGNEVYKTTKIIKY